MTIPLKSRELDRISYKPELSASMVYRELERYHIETIYDPVSSTSGAAGYFKLQNVRVIGNDLSLFTYVRGKALWENNIFTVPDDLAKALTDETVKLPRLYHYKNLGEEWFTDDERRWLEYWRREINKSKDDYVRSLAETAVSLVMDYWITSKRFGQSADWSPTGLLAFYINHVNRNILDNEESNEMWRKDPVELNDKVIADILFINPPPLKGYAAFGSREHTIESWLRGMGDYPLGRIAPAGTIGSSFENLKSYLTSLREFLEAAEHIPIWAFALSNRQPFTRLEFNDFLKSIGRNTREADLKIARHFFSRRAPDSIVIAMM